MPIKFRTLEEYTNVLFDACKGHNNMRKNTFDAGIEAAIALAAARADGLYEWMLKTEVDSDLRKQLSTRCGELTELVHDLRELINIDA